ncbi:MAG: N-acetyltransferase family protein [Pseudomonadota bacterium]
MIRDARVEDAPEIAAIYGHYVAHSTVSFEEVAPSVDEMAQRIAKTLESYPYIVDVVDGDLHGYAYAGPYRPRSAYRFTAETTVYVHKDAQGQGTGRRLYASLIERLRSTEAHLLIGAITLPNPASEALHKSFGYQRAGLLSEVGRKFDRWHDVALWQLPLDA